MADLTPDRLARLRTLAERATPGPWRVESLRDPLITAHGGDAVWHVPGLARWHGLPTSVHFARDEATARYVAAVSPDVVVGLVDEIDRLRAIVEGVAAEGAPVGIGDWCAWCGAESPAHKPDCAWLKVEGATGGS